VSTKSDNNAYPLNWLRWLVVIAIVVGGIVANSIYGDLPLLYRVLGMLVLAALALFVAANTEQGSAVWTVVKESQTHAPRN